MRADILLIQTIDNLVHENYKPTEPGAAVIVVRDGEILFRKGRHRPPKETWRAGPLDKFTKINSYWARS